MTNNNIATTVQHFIRTNFLFDETRTLEVDASLLGTGIIDSTGILELISFLEETYGLKFKDEELVADNFDSVAKISTFVSSKLPAISG